MNIRWTSWRSRLLVAGALLGFVTASVHGTSQVPEPFPTRNTFANVLKFLIATEDESTIAWAMYNDLEAQVVAANEARMGMVQWRVRWDTQHAEFRQSESGRQLAQSVADRANFFEQAILGRRDQLFADLAALLPQKSIEIGWISDANRRTGRMGPLHPRGKDLVLALIDTGIPIVPDTPSHAILSEYTTRAAALAAEREALSNRGAAVRQLVADGKRDQLRDRYERAFNNTASMRSLFKDTARRLHQLEVLSANQYDDILGEAYVQTVYEILLGQLESRTKDAGTDAGESDRLAALVQRYASASQSERDRLRAIYDDYFTDEEIAKSAEELTAIAFGELQRGPQFAPEFEAAVANAPPVEANLQAEMLAEVQKSQHFTPGDPSADRLPLVQAGDVDDFAASAELAEVEASALRAAVTQYQRDLDRAWIDSGVVGASHYLQEDIEPLLTWFRETRPELDGAFIERARDILSDEVEPAFEELLARGRARRALAVAGQHSVIRHAWHLEDLLTELEVEPTPEIEAIIVEYRVAFAGAAGQYEDRLLALLPRYKELFSPPVRTKPRDIAPLLTAWYRQGEIENVNREFLKRVVEALGPEQSETILTETLVRAYPFIFVETPAERLALRFDETDCLTEEESVLIEPVLADYRGRQWDMRQKLMAAFDEWESAETRTDHINAAAKNNIVERWTEWDATVHPAIELWPQDNRLVTSTTRRIAQAFDDVRLAELPLDIQVVLRWARDLE